MTKRNWRARAKHVAIDIDAIRDKWRVSGGIGKAEAWAVVNEYARLRGVLDDVASFLQDVCDNSPACDDYGAEEGPLPREDWCGACELRERLRTPRPAEAEARCQQAADGGSTQ